MKPDKLYNVNQVKDLFFPGRSARWVRNTFSDGAFGYVAKDDGGWLISQTAINRWFDLHHVRVLVPNVRTSQVNNLAQNQSKQ